jgi:hypothetical protein
MGIEYLRYGQVNVRRMDALELIAIKAGMWSIEDVKAEGDRLFKTLDKALEESPLPEHPNHARIEEICQELIWEHLQANRNNRILPEASR